MIYVFFSHVEESSVTLTNADGDPKDLEAIREDTRRTAMNMILEDLKKPQQCSLKAILLLFAVQ